MTDDDDDKKRSKKADTQMMIDDDDDGGSPIIPTEMKHLARLTWPIVLQMGSQQIMLACDLIYVGR